MKEQISENTLLREGKLRLNRYGKYVITNRAVPDFRDGLKVVHRRIIWAAKELNAMPGGIFYKSARVYGDCMGRLHPHGDTSIYDAMIGMVNSPVPLLDKKGNFGTWRDKPAAGRYTEVRLSKYASLMLQPDYLKAAEKRIMFSSYTNQDKEPIVLPSLIPNLLINGNQGIAYGVTSNFPPMHPEDVFNIFEKHFRGKKLNTKELAKTIRFNWPDGSTCISADEDVLAYLESGKGTLYFQPDYEINEAKRTIIFNEVPPNFNWDLTSGRVEDQPYIASIDDITDKKTQKSATIKVKFKSNVNEDFDKKAQKIIDMFTNNFTCTTNITTRHSEDNIDFSRQTLTGFVKLWGDYRVDLETERQKYLIQKYKDEIAYQDLLLYAIDNIDIIIKIIKTHETPKHELMRKLELTDAQAESILELKLRRLTRLSKDDIHREKSKFIKMKKEAIRNRDDPVPVVQTGMASGLSIVAKQMEERKNRKRERNTKE